LLLKILAIGGLTAIILQVPSWTVRGAVVIALTHSLDD
jgi:hypothetical protein